MNFNLNKREIEIIQRVLSGENNSQISEDLMMSKHTLKAYLSLISKKLSQFQKDTNNQQEKDTPNDDN